MVKVGEKKEKRLTTKEPKDQNNQWFFFKWEKIPKELRRNLGKINPKDPPGPL